jgi:SAM-dependent methyltransferase
VADIQMNKKWWGTYDWSAQGENWSETWGGSDIQFFGSILPRIRRFLPSTSVLEIAPGYGRWSQYLLSLSDNYIGIDLNEDCIAHCRERFPSNSALFYSNDGKDLSKVPDNYIDFVFSYDSLVHANIEVIEAYLQQLKEKFTPDGVGFFHHSNLGSFSADKESHNNHYRDEDVNYVLFKEACENAGLICISQEVINWGGLRGIDCFSVFTVPGSKHETEYIFEENLAYMHEAKYLKKLAHIYRA